MSKNFPLNNSELQELVKKFPTPFYIYDEAAIRKNMQEFTKAFSIFPKFREYYAVKACPNPYLLKILADEGCGADCSSLPELMLSEMAGIKGKHVIFTSNETPASEYEYAYKNGNIINLDDITHIDYLKKNLGKLPDTICFRYNPGPEKQGCNSIIGKPEEAKYGLTRDQIIEAYKICKAEGVQHFGLHTMVASNELNPNFFVDTAKLLFELCAEIKEKCDELVPHVVAQFSVDTLDYLHKGGRCSGAAKLIGHIFHVHPYIKVVDGALIVYKNPRGPMRMAIKEQLNELQAVLPNVDLDHVMITHAGVTPDIEEFAKEELGKLVPKESILVTSAGAVISSHCGFGTIGILYITK